MSAEVLTVVAEELIHAVESVFSHRMELACYSCCPNAVAQAIRTTMKRNVMTAAENFDRVDSDDCGAFFFGESIKMGDFSVAQVHAPVPGIRAEKTVETSLDDRTNWECLHLIWILC